MSDQVLEHVIGLTKAMARVEQKVDDNRMHMDSLKKDINEYRGGINEWRKLIDIRVDKVEEAHHKVWGGIIATRWIIAAITAGASAAFWIVQKLGLN